jgi:hypothetical protein
MHRYIAVYTKSSRVTPAKLTSAIMAISRQMEALRTYWGDIEPHIVYSETENPASGWERVGIFDSLDYKDVNGFHAVKDGQPFASIRYSEYWTMDLSHEIIEMLVDPRGDRTISGPSLDGSKQVNYLLEPCDPCQDYYDGYTIDGVRVCNFCTPAYFTGSNDPGQTYSMLGDGDLPVVGSGLEIRPYGYLVWQDPDDRKYYRADRFTGGGLNVQEINPPALNFSTMRAAVDAESDPYIMARRRALKKLRRLSEKNFLDPKMLKARRSPDRSLRSSLKKLDARACKYFSSVQPLARKIESQTCSAIVHAENACRKLSRGTKRRGK